MRILRTYLLREFTGPLFLTLGVLTFVMVAVGNLQRVADLIIVKGVDFFSVGKLLLLMAPYIVTYALPISVLTAAIVAFGRLSSDNEITAIRASGIHLFSLILPLLICGLIVSLALVLFNDKAASYAHYAYRRTLVDIGLKNPTAALEEGVFIDTFQKYILFIYRVDQKNNRLTNIRIYEPQGEDKPPRAIVAKSGEFITDPERNIVKLKLMDGTSDEPDPENPKNFYKLNFKTYFMNLNIGGARGKKNVEKKPRDMTLRELRDNIARLSRESINSAPLVTEIHERCSLAFSCFVFILLGSSLGIMTRRREKSINIGIAVLVIAFYYPLLIACEALGMQNKIPPALALWLPDIIFGAIGGVLSIRVCVS